MQAADEEAIEGIARDLIEHNPGATADYRAGKTAALEWLVGQVLAALGSRAADPALVRHVVLRLLEVGDVGG